VSGEVSALEAFHHMAADHKSTLGIVDAAGKLLGNLSVSDLRYLPAAGFALLLRPVAEYVALVHGKGPSIAEAVSGTRVEVGAQQAPVLLLLLQQLLHTWLHPLLFSSTMQNCHLRSGRWAI
jgi:hypothetical protein